MENDYLPAIGQKLNKLGIVCSVVAGGSYSYKYEQISDLNEFRDLDILIITNNKLTSIDLLKKYQKDLQSTMKISQPEVEFNKNLTPFVNGWADAIRYSGINIFGQKISAKIIDYEFLYNLYTSDHPGRINLLSYKDKRFFERKSLDGQNIYLGIISQKTTEGLTVIGDPDFFTLNKNYSLGVISDVLLSGKIIYQHTNNELENLRNELIKKIVKLSSVYSIETDWENILVRSNRFPESFKNQFRAYIKSVISSNEQTIFNKNIVPTFNLNIVTPIIRKNIVPYSINAKSNVPIKEFRYLPNPKTFSINSKYGVAVLGDNKQYFFKEMLNDTRYRSELFGLMTVSSYFTFIQKPVIVDPIKNLILYRWNEGGTLSQKRLNKIDNELFNNIMQLELRRSEDYLNAYLYSSSDIVHNNIPMKDIYFSRIHELFFGRLNDEYINSYYKNTILRYNDHEINFMDLWDREIVINGQQYDSMANIIKKASQILNPDVLNSNLLVCGLGDGHGGNIMFKDNPNDYTYIDYEFAGFHSPYLDMAKPIYYDCFYNAFYSNMLNLNFEDIELIINDTQLIINHTWKLDELGKYLLKCKIEGILIPFRDYLSSNNIMAGDNWLEILGNALFCCGFLSRKPNFFANQNNFLINLANSIETLYFGDYYNNINLLEPDGN